MTGRHEETGVPEPLLQGIASLLEERAGLVLEGVYRRALAESVAARTAATGSADAGEYLGRLRSNAGGELDTLIECVVIGETRFLRNLAHFRVLREVILPGLAPEQSRFCLWSAGCASGEEPYSLAIACLDTGFFAAGRTLTILGTDINRSALSFARRAEYAERQLAHVGSELRDRYFEPSGNRWRVREHVRAAVSFRYHNLLDPSLPAPPSSVDVLFCQNVTIYFRPEVMRAVFIRLTEALREGGYLFPGFSETLNEGLPGMSAVAFGDCFAYRKDPPRRSARLARQAERSNGRPAVREGHAAARREGTATRGAAGLNRPETPAELLPAASSSPEAAAALAAAQKDAFEGRTDTALARARRAVELDPLLSEGWELVGLLSRQTGQRAQAEQAFRRQLYLAPDSALAHFHLGALFHEAGRAGDARREYANAARLLEALPPDTPLNGVAAGLLLRACRQYTEGER